MLGRGSKIGDDGRGGPEEGIGRGHGSDFGGINSWMPSMSRGNVVGGSKKDNARRKKRVAIRSTHAQKVDGGGIQSTIISPCF